MTRPEAFPSKTGYALVTGGATRLGAAIARKLAADGWRMVIHHRSSSQEAETMLTELRAGGTQAAHFPFDLLDRDYSQFFKRVESSFGFCGLLVNSASMFEYDDVATFSEKAFDDVMAVNVRAPLSLAREFRAQLPAGEKGLVVNILDQKVFNLNPDFLSYTLSKSALSTATQLLAVAMAPDVRVCGVAPGLTLQSGEQSAEGFEAVHGKTPLGFGSLPSDIAEAVAFLTRMPAMTGTTLIVDGGQHLEPRTHDVMFSYGIAPDAPVGRKR
jgi:NAD(P)-dependent dehydrogenase (short-subunit alcohol dehydrogenase family)